MTPFKLALLAIGSAALAVAQADAARPRYGGTLRILDAGTIASPDPAAQPSDDAERGARMRLLPLVFETLVAVDPSGGLRPALSVAWECDARCAQWRFRLRREVSLHDGSVLEPWHVAAALRRANPSWSVEAAGDAVVIGAPEPRPDLPWELAEHRFGVAVHSGGEWIGSGPFRLHRFEPRHISLRAHESYWNSRPFIDAVEVDLGQPPGDRVTSLELGRADIVSIRPTDVRRLSQRGLRTASTRALDLVAITFEPHRAEAGDDAIRRALAAAIDRPVLSDALLHGRARPATGLLPTWLSGYELRRAERPATRAAIAALPLARRRVTLRIDGTDPLAQAIAERILVDAREAGVAITVQVPAGLAPRADARLVRVKVPATSPDRALAGVMAALGARVVSLATPEGALLSGSPIESVYRLERALVDRDVIVPVVHLCDVYGIANGIESRSGAIIQPWGGWDLENVWLAVQAGVR